MNQKFHFCESEVYAKRVTVNGKFGLHPGAVPINIIKMNHHCQVV